MNLHCNKVELRQTPTWVSNVCMMTDRGPMFEVTGKRAKRALLCYVEWYKSLKRDSWEDSEQAEVDEEHAAIQRHVDEVIKVINDPDLRVYIV